MAMYYYASKISAIACGTRCRQTVLQKSRGQRDRDKYVSADDDSNARGCGDGANGADEEDDAAGGGGGVGGFGGRSGIGIEGGTDMAIYTTAAESALAEAMASAATTGDGVRHRRRHSEQLDAYDLELGFQKLEVSVRNEKKPRKCDIVQYDIPKNSYKRANSDINYESSVLGSGGIMYINGRIVSGPLESLIEVLVPKNRIDFDKEFIFSFLLSSRLFLRPHELLGKLLSSVPDSESLESLVAVLAEWTQKFPYDYRDERMMGHVKHIVARCSNTNLEGVVSEILSALLKQLTDLERHEEDLRACQSTNEKSELSKLDCLTASQYAQILCRLEKKLAKQIGPEEFLQCSSNVLLDKQKKWDQPSTSGGPPGVQDPKKTCNLETYLDWSARLRLFVCNEILQCIGIRDRSKTVELWSGVAQYCLLVGNYNSATAILESLESPPIARLKITWSKLQMTCQQLDCMQRHAEGHGDLWHKQASILNEIHQKTDPTAAVCIPANATGAAATVPNRISTTMDTTPENLAPDSSVNGASLAVELLATPTAVNTEIACGSETGAGVGAVVVSTATGATVTKPNDWVVIPVFADIVKLALAGREECLQRLPNGHINIMAFDRMAAIVGAFTKHMHAVKAPNEAPPGEYKIFCQHMQRSSKLSETGKSI
ncbi:uncharacterized protein LOC129248830 [Anastrepha obliqua]|uniref:uncharacterized protein LOC129248830 n=1 Tax=Anastrepha obliqua TaxID=95512 RepID=UPI002409D14B|nr:uncharacterized protein LOC129248830 [Anastrepha obliqua]